MLRRGLRNLWLWCVIDDFDTKINAKSAKSGRGPWQGSSIEINCTNGRIKLSYVDEIKDKDKSKGKEKSNSGFLTRMFRSENKSSSDGRLTPYSAMEQK